jgi:hypothetical protein
MNITSVTNPQWANEAQTLINCNITAVEFGNEVLPFTASADDVEAHGRAIFADIISGKYGPIAEYVPPPPPVITAEQNKATAQSKLASTDWVNQPDVYDPAYNPHLLNRDEYLQYRSQVRAIAVNPTSGPIDWPTEPTPQWSQSE